MQKIAQAVILAGGEGKRLRPFTLKKPKPMVPINGKPFLEHLINLLKENGIKEVVILTGYLGNKIEEYFGNGAKFSLQIKYSFTPFKNEAGQENESGLRLKNAQDLLKNYFLLLYCDNYWPLQLSKLTKYFKDHPSDSLVTVYSNLDHSTKNNMSIDKKGYVEKYDKTRNEKNLHGVDIGFFIVNKKTIEQLPKSNSSFELNVLPKLIKKGRLSGYLTNQQYYSISDMSRVKLAKQFLSPKKVIFLDRDGVINEKPPKAGYVKNWDEFIFLPGSIEAIKYLKNKGYQIYIISNQAGIARKAMTGKNLNEIHQKMQENLKMHATKVDGIYYCPHGWNDNCICRKPKPGLLYVASKHHSIDLTKALFIGDDKRDKQAGEAAGCKTILVSQKKNLLQIVNSLT